jgi:hypothetical protein
VYTTTTRSKLDPNTDQRKLLISFRNHAYLAHKWRPSFPRMTPMAKHTSVTDSRPPPHGIRTSNPNVVQTRVSPTRNTDPRHSAKVCIVRALRKVPRMAPKILIGTLRIMATDVDTLDTFDSAFNVAQTRIFTYIQIPTRSSASVRMSDE